MYKASSFRTANINGFTRLRIPGSERLIFRPQNQSSVVLRPT